MKTLYECLFGKGKRLFGFSSFFVFLLGLTLTTSAGPKPAVFWGEATARVEGKSIVVRARLRNDQTDVWRLFGPDRVVFSAMVVDGSGNPVPNCSGEVGFAYPVPQGTWATVDAMRIQAPSLPGRYTVLVGPVRYPAGARRGVALDVKQVEIVIP
ncbi:MAG TPA: hypothetical protein PKK84_00470 [Armatimonadota bacterium]|nr:hypothetical protein [Armatimonadota bacterium]